MSPRLRVTSLLLAVVLFGRIVDELDLDIENRPQVSADSLTARTALENPSPPGLERSAGPDPWRPRHPASGIGAADSMAINQVSAKELQALPGVGPVLAERIIQERTLHGPFHSSQDLRRVRGIGKKLAQKLSPRIRFQ